MIRFFFAAIAAACISFVACAQEADETARAEAKAKAAEQIKAADADKDGSISLAEIRKARSNLRKALIAARDDGAATKELVENSRNLIEMQLFLAADAGNDNALSEEELVAYLLSTSENKRWRLSDNDLEMLAQDIGEDRWAWAAARYDADQDARLSKTELSRDLKTDKDRQEFDDADLDNDGALSSYEFMKAGIERYKEKAKAKIDKARAEFGADATAAPDDPFALYKKKGRKWMHKSTVNMEGMNAMIMYMKYEITEVTDDYAMMNLISLDKDKKPMAGMEKGTETKIEFRSHPAVDGPQQPMPKKETITCEAGEFECYFTEANENKSWVSTKYPGLLVKMEGKTISMELVEFKD